MKMQLNQIKRLVRRLQKAQSAKRSCQTMPTLPVSEGRHAKRSCQTMPTLPSRESRRAKRFGEGEYKKLSTLCLKLLGATSLTLALAACSFGPVKTPSVANYFLQPLDIQMKYSHTAKHPKTILVATIQSAPGYQTNAMHYVITPFQLQSFATHAWVSPPAKLWQPILQTALTHAQVGAIVATPTPVQADYRLDVRLNRFEQNFQKPQSVFVMQASVVLQNIHTGRVAGQRTFNIRIPAQKSTPYAGVLAANKAVSEMDKDIISYLSKRIK